MRTMAFDATSGDINKDTLLLGVADNLNRMYRIRTIDKKIASEDSSKIT